MESIAITYRQTLTLQELKFMRGLMLFRQSAQPVGGDPLSGDELDVKAFERKTGGVLLTDAGERVIEQARRVLAGAERVKSIAKSGRKPLAGVLRLGVIPTIAPYLLPDLVQVLRMAAPQTPLDIEKNLDRESGSVVACGEFDAAILALPFEVPGIETLPLYDEKFCLMVPAKYPWAKRMRIALEELRPADLLLRPVG